jgi:hypothetical protein
MPTRREVLAAGLALLAPSRPGSEEHRDRSWDREAAALSLLTLGKEAFKADATAFNLLGETRIRSAWADRTLQSMRLRERPFLRLVLADELEPGLVRGLEQTRELEPGSLLVVVTTAGFEECGPVAERLRAPVLRLTGGTFDDAVRAWFNPLAVPGLTGFHPGQMERLANRTAVGFVSQVDASGSLELPLRLAPAATAWLLHLASDNLADASGLLCELQSATPRGAAMVASIAASPAGTRGSLAVLIDPPQR